MGKLLIFSAPSGSGKTTIVKRLLNSGINLEFSVSATSREIRGDERDGIDYFFFDADEFRKKIEKDEFVEWEEVYKDHYYGTLKSEVERIWDSGNHVVFDVDVEGGINLKKIFGDKALSVFIMPPSIKSLKERLINRDTDTIEKIEMRLAKARNEITRANEFDAIVINDNLDTACSEVLEIATDFLSTKD